jgi:ribosomal protein S18 acetylase RimI-like enzyme
MLTIQPARLHDVPQLVQLVNSAYRGETSKKGWTTEADLLDGIRIDEAAITEMINNKQGVILKCTDEENTLLGCVFLEQQGQQLYLGMLTVQPSIQTKGIGKRLLHAAEAYAHEHDCNAIVMTVISVRHELIAWYERHGYRPTGDKKPFPNDPRFGIPKQPLEFIVLYKPL